MECQLENINVYYETCGQGRPIIAIHGFTPDHHLMTGCMEPVFSQRDDWHRFYPDLPGMGKTLGPKWLTNSDQMLDVLLDFIDAVIPGQNFALAGESYGGYLARGIVHRWPERVDGLFLLCPLIVAEHDNRDVPEFVVLKRDQAALDQLSSKDRENFESVAVVQTQTTWERTRDEVVVGLDAADEWFLAKLSARGYPFSFDVDDAPPFEKPALILTGRQDHMVGYRDGWNIYENYPRGSYVVLDRAGHNLQIEQPTVFNALVNEWLDRIEEN
jgi:pimeloyl-ACP methyl ester carboxylesterase